MATSYHALNEREAIRFAANLPDLFPSDADPVCEEIGDGNLNLVFRVQDRRSRKSVIIKQALPYAKVVGESWPLTLERSRIESDALILQAAHCPERVPRVYRYDRDLALTAMEDLSDHTIMRQGLIACERYPLFAGHISEFLAKTLFYTSDLGMNLQEKKKQVGRFINPELCKITEDLIFDHPYTDADTNQFDEAIRDEVEAIWQDGELQLEVALLRESFLTHAQALLHGDLHTGSIFVTAHSTKVIDPEFAFYGPMGFDIGAVVGNLLLNYTGQEAWSGDIEQRRSYRDYLLATVEELWQGFEARFIALWDADLKDRMASVEGYRAQYMKRLLRDTIGFAGCKMIRRTIGLAHVADIDQIADGDAKERAQRMALAIGKTLVRHHRRAESIGQVRQWIDEAITQ